MLQASPQQINEIIKDYNYLEMLRASLKSEKLEVKQETLETVLRILNLGGNEYISAILSTDVVARIKELLENPFLSPLAKAILTFDEDN